MEEDGNLTNDEIIRSNLRLFLPYIAQCIPATQLLAHIHIFDKGQRKEIFSISCSRPHQATEMALQILLDQTELQGQFVSLIQALENLGYQKVVNILSGKYIPSDLYDEKILNLFTLAIIKQLDPVEILPYLMKYGVMGEEEKQNILAENMNHGPMRASYLLLSYLPSRTEDWFRHFIRALIDCHHEDLAKSLEPDLFLKIMAQTTAEKQEAGHRSNERMLQTSCVEHFLSDEGEADTDLKADNIEDPKDVIKDDADVGDVAEPSREIIKYDSDFLLSLRHSPLANYIPRELLKHPEIFCRVIQQSLKGAIMAAYGGARPKFPLSASRAADKKVIERNLCDDYQADVPSVPNRDQMKDKHSEKEDPLDNMNDLQKDLEELLLGDLIRTEHRQADKSDIFEKENYEGNEKGKRKKCQQVDDVSEGHQLLGENVEDKNRRTVLKVKLGENFFCTADTVFNSNGGARPKVRNYTTQNRDSDLQTLAYFPSGNHSQPEEIPNKNKDAAADTRKAHNETSSDLVNLKDNADQPKDMYDLEKVFADLLLGDLPELFDDLNALGNVETIYNRSDSIEASYNIDTDSDEIEGVEDTETVDLREYQKELAREGIEGENVIIMAPTNSGKTRVAVRIVQEHLRRQRREQRIATVIFLVQDEILAIQQARTFAELLPAYRTKIISGTTQRDKKEFLKDFIARRDILVVTAQVLINALELGEIKDLTHFTMMVFDECHHANKCHPYNQILGKYMDLKIGQKADARELPQIVGMTASLGCGGNLVRKRAMEHMKNVMVNMDARRLCTVRKNKEELRRYVNKPVEGIREVSQRDDNGFELAVNELIDRMDHYMLTNTEWVPGVKHIIPGGRGTEQFCQWLAKFKKHVAATGPENARVMNPCRHHLVVYNIALMIYKDVRVKEAMKIIDKYISYFNRQPDKDDTDKFLIELYEDLKQKSFDTEPENPKLKEMQRIILEVLGHDDNARGVVFVKTRQLAQALISWMNDMEELKEFSAAEMVGQTAPAHKGGSTKRQLVDVVDYFKGGRHKILVATSVLEEGIDISKCNLVIRYEHVTNEIVRLQSRGRARAADSKYFVLTEADSKIAAKEEKNRLLEMLMNELVPELQKYLERDDNNWEEEMFKIQQSMFDVELQKKRKRESEMNYTSVSIQCLNCHTEICKSHDIKKIKNVHHIIVGLEAAKNFLFCSSSGGFDDEELEYSGTITCVNCFYDLGCICIYKDTQFPMLKISSWRDAHGKSYKTWKKVPYWIETFTLDDLRDVVEQREAIRD